MKLSFIAVTCCLVATAAGASEPVVQPIQVGRETVRFDHAVPTLDLQQPHGAVQVTPLPMDHGGLAFEVAVLNNGGAPANFDITDVAARAGSQNLPVFSRQQLEAKAKHRAMWASIALAAVGGLGAAAAASQRDYYHSTLVTPHGTYRATYDAPSTAGQIQSAALVAGTGAGLVAIQNRLDQTRAAIGDSTVQMTTIDPTESYAGRIVLPKIKNAASPQRVDMVIHWNGDDYPFAFQVAKEGTPAPIFRALTPVVPEPAAAAAGVAPAAQATVPATAPVAAATFTAEQVATTSR